MVWVRIDDHFDEHPKIAALSDSAVAVMVAGLAYCNRNLTDGFIPHMIGLGKLRFCDGNSTPILRELESAGIFERVNGGWHIHDYLDYQPSKQRVMEERSASARRMQGTRRRRKVARDVAPQHADMLQTSCTFPVPVPVPVLNTLVDDSASTSKKSASKKPADPNVKLLIDHWYQTYLARFKAKPPVNGAKSGAVAKKILCGRSLEEAKWLIEEHIRNPLDYYEKKVMYSLEHVLIAAPQLLARRAMREEVSP